LCCNLVLLVLWLFQALVWDRALANPINLIMKHTDLKELGVVRMLALEQGIIPGGEVPETIVFICRPLVSLMPLVASCIRNEEKARRRKKFHLFFLPRTSRLCTKWLEVWVCFNFVRIKNSS